MSGETRALSFGRCELDLHGDKLLTTGNAGGGADAKLFPKLGLVTMRGEKPMRGAAE